MGINIYQVRYLPDVAKKQKSFTYQYLLGKVSTNETKKIEKTKMYQYLLGKVSTDSYGVQNIGGSVSISIR